MGQRFQVGVITRDNRDDSKDNIYRCDFHLQWCWGHYSIIRAYQLLDFFYEDMKHSYPEAVVRWTGEKNLKRILKSLIGINNMHKSYVYPEDLTVGCEKFTPTPYYYDNNDGILMLDLRGETPKYAFAFLEDSKEESIRVVNSIGYMKEYQRDYDDLDIDKKAEIDKMIDFIEKFEIMSKEDIKDLYNELKVENITYDIKSKEVYVVKVYYDISNSYNGIDDFDIYIFKSYDKAKEKLKEEFELSKVKLEYSEDLECFNLEDDETRFHINDDVNYITGELVKMEVK